MAELLIELFSEDIPARFQVRAAEDFKRLVTDRLVSSGLHFARAAGYSTPRRITLVVEGLPTRQADVTEERKGPRVGSPEKAVEGFLRAAGLDSIDQAEQRDTGKGVFYFAVIHRPGTDTIQVLPGLIEAAIREMPWPKSMRWAGHRFPWVRPLHAILALFDGRVVPGTLDLGAGKSLEFGSVTKGHRFLAPQPFTVTGFADYQEKLRAACVLLDREERRSIILSGAQQMAGAAGLVLKDDPGLADEVAGLVEWPVVLMGAIDDRFMDVPAEVLTTSMRTHQRYFATETTEGRLAPRFILAANRPTDDGGAAVVAGNERVLRARLSDAKFFWDQDRRVKLEDRLPALADITFHAKLGTMAERVTRIEALTGEICRQLGWSGTVEMKAQRAARLCKADLVTGVVGEFPEVQGIMGRYYALGEGEDAAVAEAIADHYKPLGPGDRVPSDPVAIAVALADKIDVLVNFFAIDEKPTGSRDPFALRRAALGVIRLVLDNGLRLNLGPLMATAYGTALASILRVYGLMMLTNEESRQRKTTLMPRDKALYVSEHGLNFGEVQESSARPEAERMVLKPTPLVVADLLSFFADRLKVTLREKGVRHDLVDAVFALGTEDDLVRLLARVDALASFVGSEDGANLLTAYRRAANILRIEEKKDGRSYDEAPDNALLKTEQEVELVTALEAVKAAAGPMLMREDFVAAMEQLAQLRGPVDAFFEQVTVNAPEPELRANRLRLLAAIRGTLNAVADFSRIEG